MSKTIIKVLGVTAHRKEWITVFYLDTNNGAYREVLLRIEHLKTPVFKGKYYNATLYVNLYTSLVETIDSEATPDFEVKLLNDILSDIESKLARYKHDSSPNRYKRELQRKRQRIIERIEAIGV